MKLEECDIYRTKLEKYLNEYKIFETLKSGSELLFQVDDCYLLIKKYGAFISVRGLSQSEKEKEEIKDLMKFQFADFNSLDYVISPSEGIVPSDEIKNFGKRVLELFFKKGKGMIQYGLKEVTPELLFSMNRLGFTRLMKSINLNLDNI